MPGAKTGLPVKLAELLKDWCLVIIPILVGIAFLGKAKMDVAAHHGEHGEHGGGEHGGGEHEHGGGHGEEAHHRLLLSHPPFDPVRRMLNGHLRAVFGVGA